jgi:hypothetical protein
MKPRSEPKERKTMKLLGYAVLMFSMAAAPVFAQDLLDPQGAALAPQEASGVPSYASIPSNAKSSGDLTASSHWIWGHDSGTPGSATGSSHYPESSPSLDGKSREFNMSYSNKGGVRFSITFDHNTQVTHFVYDTYVYITDPAGLSNLELDMNQVISNGKTVILSFQCSGNAGQWEYGLIKGKSPKWQHSGIACNPKNWAAKKWHHIQIASQRSSSGNVTYDWVNLDGSYHQLKGATGDGALSLHWAAGDLNLNFQLDGSESRGSVTMYADKLNIYYW